jgi:hypothetical protein
MKTLKTIGVWALVAVIFASISISFISIDLDIPVTESGAQSFLDKAVNKDIPVGKHTIYHITKATAKFGDGTIAVDGTFDVSRKGSTANGTFNASGSPIKKDQSFYLEKPEAVVVVTQHELSETDKKIANAGKKAAGIAKGIGKFLKIKPAEDGKLAKSKAVIASKAKEAIINRLAQVALYKVNPELLENMKRVSFGGVTVTDEKMVVTFSVALISNSFWLYIIAGIAAFGLVILVMKSGVGVFGFNKPPAE